MFLEENRGVTREATFNLQLSGMHGYDAEENLTYAAAAVTTNAGNINDDTDYPRSDYSLLAVKNDGGSAITLGYKLAYDSGDPARTTRINAGEVFYSVSAIIEITTDTTSQASLHLFYIDKAVDDATGPRKI